MIVRIGGSVLTRSSESEWALVLQVFRSCLPRRGDNGRDDRKSVEALHYFAVHNITWRALPAEFGNWNSIWKRFCRLSRAGVFEIKQHLVLIVDREAHADEWQRLKDVSEVSPPSMSLIEVAQCKAANGQAAERQELEAKLATCTPPDHDWKALFAERSAYEGDLARYDVDVQRYADWLVERQRQELRASELRLRLAPFPDLQRRLSVALNFEQQLTAYELLKGRFDELSSDVAAKRSSSDEWRKVKDAMTILRGLVKQHLVPSLNRVASRLIAGMTGGQRQSIVVDEDFDVTVDGQALDTLSGSGKAVANLALRLGLGQVLTSKVFSLFIGDEIDASLDLDRAEQTSSTLNQMKQLLLQIVLVTHKYTEADYCILLNENGSMGETEN